MQTFSWTPKVRHLLIAFLMIGGMGFAQDTPDSVTIAGSFQEELGCPGDWQPECTTTDLTYAIADDKWRGTFMIPAGEYEYKAALNGTWDVSYPGDNVVLSLAEDTEVTFFYDPVSNYVTDNISARIVTAAGDFQSELGCGADWDPDCLRTMMQDPDGDGVYTLVTDQLPAGPYQYKVALDESWNENYGVDGSAGGANLNFTVNAGATVTLTYNTADNIIAAQVEGGETEGPTGYAIIHYTREDGDYGDHTTGDFNDFWGLHLWGDGVAAEDQTDWTAPKPFLGQTDFGRFAWIKLSGVDGPINFIIHRGDTKDGTENDRSFNPSQGKQIWTVGDDGNDYASQADAQGYVTIHYRRNDGDYGVDTENYWGLHIWSDGGANAIDPADETDWAVPRPPDEISEYGAVFRIPLNPDDATAAFKPLKFIVHTPSGNNTAEGGDREPGGNREFIPRQNANIFLLEQDVDLYPSQGAAQNYATLHYHRADGDYGDYESDDFNNFWGVHTWEGSATDTDWEQPVRAQTIDSFGASFRIDVLPEAASFNYIIHRGDTKDPGPDQTLNLFTDGYEVWQLENANVEDPYVYPVEFQLSGNPGNIGQEQAHWAEANGIAWEAADNPTHTYRLYYNPTGGLEATVDGVTGGEFIELTYDADGLGDTAAGKFPHLANFPVLRISDADMAQVGDLLSGQLAISAVSADGISIDATGIQIPGVLDELYATDAAMGVVWNGDAPSFALWAPTAKSVTLHVYADATSDESTAVNMVWNNGVWTAEGDASMKGGYYLYEVEVYIHGTGQVERNFVTDPYSVSLSADSGRSHLLDLTDDAAMPDGWMQLTKPALDAFEDISIYEIHVRDFSILDDSVPAEHRGRFMAFTHDETDGMQHLLGLRQAGLTHLHLLPAFDIATIKENPEDRVEPDYAELAGFAPDSDQQQAIIAADGDNDGFNWGYDPWHYNVPEGSYATDAGGAARVLEFREMVQSLNEKGLRVVMDVVYNHTNASGQNQKSVLDKVVPGYYHRLDGDGAVQQSTCCENTATEHVMMEKLMVDSIVLWAKYYKVDAFRFDLMGHHMVTNMQAVRDALDALTIENDGVDGSKVYVYGEGWNFGEVANNARGVNAIQLNVGGMGIGTFSDRLRDAVRGGGPFDTGDQLKRQGFGNGLYTDPNDLDQGDQLATLLALSDQIRVGLAGNLADYPLVDRFDNATTGAGVDYNGQPAGYTLDPQEDITYISKHDNQTLYDINVYGLPVETSMEERVRAQIFGLSTVAFGQGIPFFHAGVDILRSKSLDRDSFNSGDWFNRLDWTYQTNNYGVGLPVAEKNESNWDLMRPFLSNPDLVPGMDDITRTNALFREQLQIRYSTPLFRLRTAEDITNRVSFLNTGSAQTPGVIAMHVSDMVGEDLDRSHESVTVIFNSDDEAVTFTASELAGRGLTLHPVQAMSIDERARTATFDDATGSFTVPGRTASVFVEAQEDTVTAAFDNLRNEIAALDGASGLSQGQVQQLQQFVDFAQVFYNQGSVGLSALFLRSVEFVVGLRERQGLVTEEQEAAIDAAVAAVLEAMGA